MLTLTYSGSSFKGGPSSFPSAPSGLRWLLSDLSGSRSKILQGTLGTREHEMRVRNDERTCEVTFGDIGDMQLTLGPPDRESWHAVRPLLEAPFSSS